MRRTIPPLLLVLLLSCHDDPYSGAHGNPDKPIDVKAGEIFFIRLSSNATTGYDWVTDLNPKSPVVRLVETKYVGSTDTRPGSGGSRIWKFQAGAAGRETVTFTYQRGPGDKADTAAFSIIVQ